jgi:hypothetical protein
MTCNYRQIWIEGVQYHFLFSLVHPSNLIINIKQNREKVVFGFSGMDRRMHGKE